MYSSVKILTNIAEPRVSVEWQQRTDLLSKNPDKKGILSTLIEVFRFFLICKNYDTIILDCNRVGSLLTLLSWMWPGRRKPILMIDCLWYKPRSRFVLWLKSIQIRLMALVVRKFVVWASHEVQDYAAVFSIPEEKLIYIPHHHTLEGYKFEVHEGNYIFSGGDGDRDYVTLLEAVRGLGVKVVIATRLSDWHENVAIPPEVDVFPASHVEFRKLMAASKIVIVSMKKGLLHSGGQQTYLNAMAMGKPVIVADDCGAEDYIKDGVNGLIVPSGNSEVLRATIKSLLDNQADIARLAKNAKSTYDTFSTTRCIKKILNLAEEIATNASDMRGQRPTIDELVS